MNLPPRIALAISFATLAASVGHSTHAQDNELLTRFPSSANAVAVIDVDALLATPLAKDQSWGDPTKIKYAERPLSLPKLASKVAIASQLDTSGDLSRQWELAVMALKEPVPMKSIALREGGYVDDLNGIPVVWTPSETYFVPLGDNLLGAMYPANRQFVARWAENAESNRLLKLNDYLLQSASRIDSGAQIVMALDLANVARPHSIRESLTALNVVGDDDDQIDQLAKLFLGAKGISLSVQVDEKATGTIRVEFSEDVSSFGRLAKPLLLAVLEEHDAAIPDVEEWKAELLGETVVFSGPLSTDGLRRLGSFLEPPSTKFSDLSDTAPAESGTDEYVKASQQYFHSVDTLIQDLKRSLGQTRDNHAVWMERYARKIDSLPILNVDPALLDWGASVGETFRSMSNTTKTANVRSGVRKSYAGGTNGYAQYGYGNNGGWYNNDATSVEKAKGRVERTEKGTARIQTFGNWKEVEDSAANIRIAMTQKYNVEF